VLYPKSSPVVKQ
jgi:hypothetical protein